MFVKSTKKKLNELNVFFVFDFEKRFIFRFFDIVSLLINVMMFYKDCLNITRALNAILLLSTLLIETFFKIFIFNVRLRLILEI